MIKKYGITIFLAVVLAILSVCSLFIGVLDVELSSLLSGDVMQIEIFLISRLPRLLAILCTGVGMSVAGLIMQQLCMNKFVSPTTGATISSAQFGILLALLFMPKSTLWSRAIFALSLLFWEHGFLYGLSRGFSLRMSSWCRWSELCSVMLSMV